MFVEIGAMYGKSTAFMAVELDKAGKPARFDVIDKWEDPSVMKKFKQNLTRVWHLLNAYQCDSVTASSSYSNSRLNFVFIDADHNELALTQDIMAWLPKVMQGGILAGHDYTENHPGVVAAVNKIFPAEQIRTIGSCWYIIKDV
jgi:predicted O-methyltransferase YrrM